MKQAEFAEWAGYSEATVSRLLAGERDPSVALMSLIKTAFGWSIDDQVEALETGAFPAELKARMEGTHVA